MALYKLCLYKKAIGVTLEMVCIGFKLNFFRIEYFFDHDFFNCSQFWSIFCVYSRYPKSQSQMFIFYLVYTSNVWIDWKIESAVV